MPRPKSSIANQELLRAALEGLEIQRQRIEEQIRSVQSLLGGRRGPKPAAEKAAPGRRKRRRLSAAGRKRIAEAQRRRWAEQRKGGAKSEKK
jgi:hypothetical protein